jgi:hypothetical protein
MPNGKYFLNILFICGKNTNIVFLFGNYTLLNSIYKLLK